jgi:hypothetical protein
MIDLKENYLKLQSGAAANLLKSKLLKKRFENGQETLPKQIPTYEYLKHFNCW